MSAEVLYDAVCQVTDTPAGFGGLPQDRHAPKRAIMLPDESYSSYFLDVFGRPQRISACECERVNEANLAQALHLLNSDDIQGRLSARGADALARHARTPRRCATVPVGIRSAAAGAARRRPKHIAKHQDNKKLATRTSSGRLLNSKFMFNQ
jgi:hypothetical protein